MALKIHDALNFERLETSINPLYVTDIFCILKLGCLVKDTEQRIVYHVSGEYD